MLSIVFVFISLITNLGFCSREVIMAKEQEALFRIKTIDALWRADNDVAMSADGIDQERWQIIALAQIDKDLEYIQRLKHELSLLENLSWPLKTVKIEEALRGAIPLLRDHFFTLIEGGVPHDYRIERETTTVLQDQESIWGNPKGTFLKTALFILERTAQPEASLPNLFGRQWIDTSPLAHIIDVPINLRDDYPNFTFAYQDGKTKNGLIVPHSGYAFGGHRFEPRYPNGKQFGPEDCSSFIAKLTYSLLAIDRPLLFNTSDQAALFNYISGGFVPEEWKASPDMPQMLQLYDPILVRDLQRDVQPGHVYAHRSYLGSQETTLGHSGHTALITEIRSDGVVQTLGYNRDIENGKEGFGLENFNLESTDFKKTMIFSIKKTTE